MLVLSGLLFSQSESYMFSHYKSTGDKLQVYFKIENLNSDKETQDKILEVLLMDEKITDGNIYSVDEKSATCQLEVLPGVSVDYIRNILQTTGYDIDLSSVAAKDPVKPAGIYSSDRYSFFENFDGFKDYDPNKPDAKSRVDYYNEKKVNWIDQNPDKYKDAKAQNGKTVIVKRKDLEFFKEEKRQHILSHPEIYIIED